MTELVISFAVDGLHFWPNAPAKYKEFGQPHRHLFKFVCWYPTKDSNDPNRRERELWELRQEAISSLSPFAGLYPQGGVYDFGAMSCEGCADFLKQAMGFSKVFCGEEEWLGAMVYGEQK